jgi:hypothetical protein
MSDVKTCGLGLGCRAGSSAKLGGSWGGWPRPTASLLVIDIPSAVRIRMVDKIPRVFDRAGRGVVEPSGCPPKSRTRAGRVASMRASGGMGWAEH